MTTISASQEIREIIGAKNKLEKFRQLEDKERGVILLNLPRYFQKDILKKLNDEEIISALNHISPDKATDLLQIVPHNKAHNLISKLDESIKEKVEFLLKFNPRAAAGLMTLDYVETDEKETFESVAKDLKEHEQKTGKFPTILIIKDKKLIGELLGSSLALHSPKEHIEKYIHKIPNIKYDADERKVIALFTHHPHNKVAVLDDDGDILGVINSDDVLQLLGKSGDHGLYNFAGVSRDEDILDSAFTKVKYRWKWLIINLGTAFLAASVVGLFEETISAFVLLAVYMPVVAGMGGNAGTQTLAVTIRGLMLGEVNIQTSKKIVINEMLAGATNGLINGIIVAAIATFFNKSPLLGLVLAVAMVVNLIIAGFFGAVVPMVMKATGRDPASSATIFITTATDVFGFFIFLGLASIIL